MTRLINVTLKEGGREFVFNDTTEKVNVFDYVVIENQNGFNVAKVVGVDVPMKPCYKNITDIVRVATKEDINSYKKNLKSAEEAIVKAKEIANNLGLNMTITEAGFNLDRSQLQFLFLSDTRVDFREMAKELASIYKTRIELRQIGARDKAKDISGIGQCGCELCCHRFLSDNMDAVSISMAKNQNISLNPSKINGQCGRLLCCLKYEDDIYTENRSKLPQIGDVINTKQGKGEVIALNILKQSYVIKLDDESLVEIDTNE